MRVLVTGAAGRTGRVVVRKLLERGVKSFVVRALVRTSRSEDALRRYLGIYAQSLEVVCGDITQPATLDYAFTGVDAVVIATGSRPQIDRQSLASATALKMLSFGLVDKPPSICFAPGCTPEEVDWIGQRNQIDAAAMAGARHVVLISSMAGTRPGHPFNRDLWNTALWKRRTEQHLRETGVPYTVIHAGRLLPRDGGLPGAPHSAPGGRRQLFLGVDDSLLDDGRDHDAIPREDLAQICVQCLTEPAAVGRSFDLGSGPEGVGQIYRGNFRALLASLKGKNCNYRDAPDPEQLYREPKPSHAMLRSLLLCAMVPPTCCNHCCQSSSGRDVADAEPPGMYRILDETNVKTAQRNELALSLLPA